MWTKRTETSLFFTYDISQSKAVRCMMAIKSFFFPVTTHVYKSLQFSITHWEYFIRHCCIIIRRLHAGMGSGCVSIFSTNCDSPGKWESGTPSFEMQIKSEVIAVESWYTRDYSMQFCNGNRISKHRLLFVCRGSCNFRWFPSRLTHLCLLLMRVKYKVLVLGFKLLWN